MIIGQQGYSQHLAPKEVSPTWIKNLGQKGQEKLQIILQCFQDQRPLPGFPRS